MITTTTADTITLSLTDETLQEQVTDFADTLIPVFEDRAGQYLAFDPRRHLLADLESEAKDFLHRLDTRTADQIEEITRFDDDGVGNVASHSAAAVSEEVKDLIEDARNAGDEFDIDSLEERLTGIVRDAVLEAMRNNSL